MNDRPITDGGRDDTAEEQSAQLTYEIGAAERPSEAVVLAVSRVRETSHTKLEPLYDTIDPEHLDGCLQPPGEHSAEPELSVTFAGCSVTATPSEVVVQPQTPDS